MIDESSHVCNQFPCTSQGIGPDGKVEKPEKEIMSEIQVSFVVGNAKQVAPLAREPMRCSAQAIIRQITASVTFLPLLEEPCTFDMLVYTDKDVQVN